MQFLERGATVESDVLANVKAVLPPEAATLLNDLIPEPPNKHVSAKGVRGLRASGQDCCGPDLTHTTAAPEHTASPCVLVSCGLWPGRR